jgi:hypothetical protein
MTLCIFMLFGHASAQIKPNTNLPSDMHRSSMIVPFFFEKDDDVGSPYLAKSWISGYIITENQQRLPAPHQFLLFNYDKVHSLIYLVNNLNKVSSYPIDSVSSFELVENNVIYSFEKIPMVSRKYYLMPIIKSVKGYSLYKRLLTNLVLADYVNEGYTTKGRKYDEYVDFFEYYIIYPGRKSYKKLYLKESNVRRAFSSDSKLLDEFFSIHDNEITEQSLLAIVQYINDKKYPE